MPPSCAVILIQERRSWSNRNSFYWLLARVSFAAGSSPSSISNAAHMLPHLRQIQHVDQGATTGQFPYWSIAFNAVSVSEQAARERIGSFYTKSKVAKRRMVARQLGYVVVRIGAIADSMVE
jgi:hypothetical protein